MNNHLFPTNGLLLLSVWFIVCVPSLTGQEPTTAEIIDLAGQACDTHGRKRNDARAQIANNRDRYIELLLRSLREEQHPGRIGEMSTALHRLLVPWRETPSYVHGPAGQYSLLRAPESKNANVCRPVPCVHAVAVRKTLLDKLEMLVAEEPLAAQAIETAEYDPVKTRRWSDCFDAIGRVCDCLREVAEFEDLTLMAAIIRRHISADVMTCMEEILGLPGLCGPL